MSGDKPQLCQYTKRVQIRCANTTGVYHNSLLYTKPYHTSSWRDALHILGGLLVNTSAAFAKEGLHWIIFQHEENHGEEMGICATNMPRIRGFEHAYDSIYRENLQNIKSSFGFPFKLIAVIHLCLLASKARVKGKEKLSEIFDICSGLQQAVSRGCKVRCKITIRD